MPKEYRKTKCGWCSKEISVNAIDRHSKTCASRPEGATDPEEYRKEQNLKEFLKNHPEVAYLENYTLGEMNADDRELLRLALQ